MNKRKALRYSRLLLNAFEVVNKCGADIIHDEDELNDIKDFLLEEAHAYQNYAEQQPARVEIDMTKRTERALQLFSDAVEEMINYGRI